MAEECGLIVPLGEGCCEPLSSSSRRGIARGLPHLAMAVNLSTLQLEQRGLPLLVEQMLAETGIAARCLELEITESVAAEDVERTTGVLRKLRALGTRIFPRRFRHGPIVLELPEAFPGGRLKIDRSFVRGLRNGAGNEAIVRAVIGLAHGLGLKVVAEGVETAAQMAFLRERGLRRAPRLSRCSPGAGFVVARAAGIPVRNGNDRTPLRPELRAGVLRSRRRSDADPVAARLLGLVESRIRARTRATLPSSPAAWKAAPALIVIARGRFRPGSATSGPRRRSARRPPRVPRDPRRAGSTANSSPPQR
jgi:hypothetical protein